MNTTMPSDNLFTRLRQKANGLVRNVKRLVGDSLQKQPSGDDAEQSIEEFERLSGRATLADGVLIETKFIGAVR